MTRLDAPAELTEVQQRWLSLEYGLFLHFGVNTFAGVGWGDGRFPASSFAPDGVDTDQWARVAVEAGMRYAVLTTKHHDGFCLWPSRLTNYCVRHSPCGLDVVGSFVESCARFGIRPGLYYSLWDRNFPSYEDDHAYADFLFAQIEELLTQYGPIVELWFDGGWDKDHPTRKWEWDESWRKTIDADVLNGGRWRWSELYDHIHRLQPDCLVLNNSGSDRPGWVRCWPTDLRSAEHFDFVHRDQLCEPILDRLHVGPDGRSHLLPLEFCTSLNPSWFHTPAYYIHPSVATISDWRRRARAAGANLLLNVGPDQRGRIPDINRRVLSKAAM